ncbi:hypothetical protein [Sporosarcina sp.]|uniref:hypothetical protein n=1 Tax=Sporosarcina sp. TaxID=49982 RepID=UPI0026349D6A|nr:hypothetical protein [Sporosarcina sp.]
MSTEEMVLVPDAVFIHHCYSEYKLSKKIHNEIDLFFYRYGIDKRSERRRHHLAFLEYIKMKELNSEKYLKTREIVLSQEIEEYLEEPYVLLYMREKAI